MRSRAASLSVFVIAALVASAPAPAARPKKPADTTAPSITHTPPSSCPVAVGDAPAAPCEIAAVIVDDSGVFDPTLLFRLKGGAAYDRAPMKKRDGDSYVGVVPAAVAAAGDVEYLIEAFDVEGNGPARAGTEAGPLLLSKPAPAASVVPPPPPPPPAAVEDDNTGLVVGAVAAGVVVVAAAAVGIGYAVYALRAPAVDVVTVSVDAGSPFAGARP